MLTEVEYFILPFSYVLARWTLALNSSLYVVFQRFVFLSLILWPAFDDLYFDIDKKSLHTCPSLLVLQASCRIKSVIHFAC